MKKRLMSASLLLAASLPTHLLRIRYEDRFGNQQLTESELLENHLQQVYPSAN